MPSTWGLKLRCAAGLDVVCCLNHAISVLAELCVCRRFPAAVQRPASPAKVASTMSFQSLQGCACAGQRTQQLRGQRVQHLQARPFLVRPFSLVCAQDSASSSSQASEAGGEVPQELMAALRGQAAAQVASVSSAPRLRVVSCCSVPAVQGGDAGAHHCAAMCCPNSHQVAPHLKCFRGW